VKQNKASSRSADLLSRQIEGLKKEHELLELQSTRPYSRFNLPIESVHKYGKELVEVKEEDREELEAILGRIDRSELLLCELREQDSAIADTKIARPPPLVRRRRQHRRVDPRKVLIAELKARHPDAPARKICELIDNHVNTTPISKHALAPLESWRTKALVTRSWVDVYDHPKTHESVRSYVNKVPPLKITK
jgi:hypothetical protein